MARPIPISKRQAWILLLAAIALLVVCLAFHAPLAVPRVIVAPALTPFPTNPIPWTARLLAKTGPWPWRLRRLLFGPPRSYRMVFIAFGFTNSPGAFAAQLNLGAPVAVTNGLSIWSVPPAACPDLETRAGAFVGTPFIDTPSSAVAFGSMGGYACTLCYAERLRNGVLDLQLTIHKYKGSSPQDETFTALHAFLPQGSALFLAPTNPAPILTPAGFLPRSGLLVSAIVTDSRGVSTKY